MKGTTLILVVVFALTSGEDLSKKNPDKCSLRDEATMGVCLKRGYQPALKNCKAEETDYKMKKKEKTRCKNTEARLKTCKYTCDEKPTLPVPEPTEKPGPEPTEPSPDPIRPDKIVQKCGHENTNFPGAELFNRIYGSIEDCLKDCLRTKSCKSVTYRDSDRRCYFKSMYGGSAGPTTLAGHTSVNMKCDRSPKKMSCQREGINFYGADIRNIVSAGIEECVIFCRDTENCKSISFLEASQRCYLKSKYGGLSGPVISAGYTSMNMECDNSPVKNLNCLREGINFASADLRSIVVADEEECVRHCRDTELCVAFTFVESNHYCYLKSKRGGYYGPTKVAGYNSLNMVCDNSPVKNLNCLREDYNFPGADKRNLIVADVEECVRHCRDTDGCKALTFIESNHYCYLKSKRGGASGPKPVAGYHSMNMECDNSKVTNLNCLREGLNFPSSDIGNLVVADEEECVRHCRDTELCVAFTFIESNHYCYLKSNRGGYYGPTKVAGYNSLNMVCDNSKVDLSCAEEDDNFPGNQLRSIVVEDLEECVRMCRDTERCFSVSFNEINNQCSLKSKEFEWWQITSAINYWSTNIKC